MRMYNEFNPYFNQWDWGILFESAKCTLTKHTPIRMAAAGANR